MKPRFWLTPFIFAAGYSPLSLILLIKDVDIPARDFSHPWLAWTLVGLTALSILLTLGTLWSVGSGVGLPVTINTVKDRSGNLIEYSLPYIVSFLDVGLGEPRSLLTLGIFMGLLFFVSLRTNTLYMSPILLLAKYRLLEVELREAGQQKTRLLLVQGEVEPGQILRVQNFSPEILLASYDSSTRTRRNRQGHGSSQTVEERRIEPSAHEFMGASSQA